MSRDIRIKFWWYFNYTKRHSLIKNIRLSKSVLSSFGGENSKFPKTGDIQAKNIVVEIAAETEAKTKS